jgi:hypothetical protein
MLAVELHTATFNISGIWRTWGPVLALIVAAATGVAIFTQGRSAKEALRLAREQDERSRARLNVELKDAIRWFSANDPFRYFGVRLLVVNPSDSSGTLVGAELHVSYRTVNGRLLMLKVPHDVKGVALPEEISPITLTAGLPSNGALDGWLIFQVPYSMLEQAEIEGYIVTLYDSRNMRRTVQPSIFRRIEA